MNDNLQSVLISGIGMVILIAVLGVLFWRLKDITFYNVAIFGFLAVFWTVATLIKKAIYNDNPFKTDPGYTILHQSADGINIWIWPVIFASFQFIQVIFRMIFGFVARKMGSRKLPILIAASFSTVALVMIAASHIAPWSIAMGMLATGVLGSTFGMQNAYFSENYNVRSVYISMGIVAIAPAFSCLSAGFIKAGWKLWEPSSGLAKTHNDIATSASSIDSLVWILVGAIILMVIVAIIDVFFFKEHKETIGLDHIEENDHNLISQINYKTLFRFATLMMAMSFGFNIVTAGGTSQEQTTVWVSPEFEMLTLVGIIVSLVTALYLARVFQARHLILLGDSLVFIGLSMALGAEWTGHGEDKLWWLTYLIIMTIGFNIFQNTYLGIAMHIAHKNRRFVLPAIFCVRSFMYGSGQMTGEYLRMKGGVDGHWAHVNEGTKNAWYQVVGTDGKITWTQDVNAQGVDIHNAQQWVPADYLKYILIPALVISFISMVVIFFSCRSRNFNMIFMITDKYEYKAFKEHRKDIWKPIRVRHNS